MTQTTGRLRKEIIPELSHRNVSCSQPQSSLIPVPSRRRNIAGIPNPLFRGQLGTSAPVRSHPQQTRDPRGKGPRPSAGRRWGTAAGPGHGASGIVSSRTCSASALPFPTRALPGIPAHGLRGMAPQPTCRGVMGSGASGVRRGDSRSRTVTALPASLGHFPVLPPPDRERVFPQPRVLHPPASRGGIPFEIGRAHV